MNLRWFVKENGERVLQLLVASQGTPYVSFGTEEIGIIKNFESDIWQDVPVITEQKTDLNSCKDEYLYRDDNGNTIPDATPMRDSSNKPREFWINNNESQSIGGGIVVQSAYNSPFNLNNPIHVTEVIPGARLITRKQILLALHGASDCKVGDSFVPILKQLGFEE